MSYIILDNSVWDDLYRVRTERLSALKNFIAAHAPALSLPAELLNWALAAYDIWYAALLKSKNEWAEKEGATLAIQLAETPARERVNIIKELLASRYADYPTVREDYDLDESIPRARRDMIIFGDSLIRMHDERKAEGDPLVLPDAMMDNFVALMDTLKAAIETSRAERRQAKDATRELHDLFDTDSKMLALLYDWAVAMWGADDPRMIEIGFVQRFPQSGGGGGDVPAAPTGFDYMWLEPFLKFAWDALESVTSYQIAYSEDGDTWEELHTGEEVGYEYEPPEGSRKYRVRARNANGYGDWSGIIEYEVPVEPPVGEWPNAPENFGVEPITDPSDFMRVYYLIPGGADSVSLYRSEVDSGGAPPVRSDTPYATNLIEEQYADTGIVAGKDYYYWVCGVKGGIEGDFAGPVMVSY